MTNHGAFLWSGMRPETDLPLWQRIILLPLYLLMHGYHCIRGHPFMYSTETTSCGTTKQEVTGAMTDTEHSTDVMDRPINESADDSLERLLWEHHVEKYDYRDGGPELCENCNKWYERIDGLCGPCHERQVDQRPPRCPACNRISESPTKYDGSEWYCDNDDCRVYRFLEVESVKLGTGQEVGND